MSKKPTYKELEEKIKALEKENARLKKVGAGLISSSENFSKLFNSSPNLIVISTSDDGRFIDVNKAFTRLSGYEPQEVIGYTFRDLGIFADPDNLRLMKNILEKHGAVKNLEVDFRTKSGEIIKGVLSADIIHMDGENRLIIMINDLTDHRQTEEALKLSDERYRNLFEKAPCGISLTTPGGELITCNETMTRMTGYTIDELKKTNLSKLYENPSDREALFKTAEMDGTVLNAPVRLIHKDGTTIHTLLTLTKVPDPQGKNLFQSICIDVTGLEKIEEEKTRLEVQLQQVRKMDAIAALAGGIAHKFNNALAVIMSNLELLNMSSPDDENIIRYTEPTRDMVNRMADLTDQLLAYARGGKYQPKIISLSDFVGETLSLLKHTISPSIQLESDVPKDTFNVKVDLTQMQIVISAILSNSSEAIDGEGLIRVSCRNEIITKEKAIDFPGLKTGPCVKLTIEDNGKGMDEETRRRVFEPFFTTKFYGRGLAMAAVYGIIKNHGGWISIESESGKGTKVHLYIPAIEEKVEKDEKPKHDLIRGTGTILIIEDELHLMELCHRMLIKLGYNVLKAQTGAEAIKIITTFDGEIDLAILDIMLPDMEGKTIYTALKGARPDTKVIICSGYSTDGPVQEILDSGAHAFIQKPFSIEDLSAEINELLKTIPQ